VGVERVSRREKKKKKGKVLSFLGEKTDNVAC
jgi:hypothetical protein